jgi:curli production assembly/transport component CsgG
MVEGSIIGYESNVKSGGVGARYFGIGADTQYQLDQIAVNLRVVNVSTGEILSSVNTSKTILSYEVQAGVFRFIDYQRLLEGEIGYTSNEPVMLCLMSAIETGVIFLINDGIDRGLWDLQDKKQVDNDILVNTAICRYRQNPDGTHKKREETLTLFYLLVSVGDIRFSRRDASHRPLFFIA